MSTDARAVRGARRSSVRLAAAALLLLQLGTARAQHGAADSLDPAEHTPLARPNPLRAFLPSAAARASEQQARGEALLERRLALLPGVQGVHVRLVLPDLERAPLDRPLPRALAHVLLRTAEPASPSQAETARVVAEALPELAPLEVSLTRTPGARQQASSPAALVQVGPFSVAPDSAPALRFALAACLVSNMALASLLLLRRRPR